ncbi:IclR family transcriptional regulator [Sulfitobacter sp. M57]|uniref:IclR family transcriptional regulator n=1 Tax=unclassified Sulfitobacter TaxID=196795 RepID=UPI0023E130F2|nr:MULTISPECIES: IclR family transcriptional regulator [unclassified Sulfitobacter]MDF3413221.1 IclR family transcriptional regulator [Sulfitobacter sp. KE5]MDF3421496.1 IclR family transcriptional regulator [Sulfitobacter sp. KE43]MDF3431770.1 IclR family transcriptional regulator [Sulfitobacter sp. KE42]MDF3457410.1 IclR family transcriptional regulator [Sulfitobacter sp. S74]MDF3461313.1 IclR family transcriptional regulator [Sulfitobacter sp. Ks18]
MAEKQNTLYVGALAKGLLVLRAFDKTATELSLTELAARTGLDKSATQRLANTLFVEGMLDKDPKTKRFRPSHAWLRMAYTYFWSNPLIQLAMPRLIELSQHLGATANLAEISGDHILYVSRIPGKTSHFASTIVGRRLPALTTAAGRAILSTWPATDRAQAVATWTVEQITSQTTLDRDEIGRAIDQVADQGYAETQGQAMLGHTGVSAPVVGPDNVAFAAVQCSFPSRTWPAARIQEEALPHILEAANAIAPQVRPGRYTDEVGRLQV